MTALNMLLFNLNADIYQGNSLSMEMSCLWRIRKGGFIWETKVSDKEPEYKVTYEGGRKGWRATKTSQPQEEETTQDTTLIEESPTTTAEKSTPTQAQLPVELPPPEQPARVKKSGKSKQSSSVVQHILFDFDDEEESD